MARRKRTDTAATGSQGAAGVYDDMLAEAGVSAQQQQQHSSPQADRPLKRRRAGRQQQDEAPQQQKQQLSEDDDEDDEDIELEDVSLPVPTVQTMKMDSDEDSDDEDIEFEDVDLTATTAAASSAAGPSNGGNLELNLSAEKAALTPSKRAAERRRKPMTREERQQRIAIHQAHVLCLLFHAARRNQWCNDAEAQKLLRRHLTDKMVTYLTPGANLSQFGRAESIKNGLRQADVMWKTKFEKTERGLRRALWAEDAEQLQNVGTLSLHSPSTVC